jgi:hypothetical protein
MKNHRGGRGERFSPGREMSARGKCVSLRQKALEYEAKCRCILNSGRQAVRRAGGLDDPASIGTVQGKIDTLCPLRLCGEPDADTKGICILLRRGFAC